MALSALQREHWFAPSHFPFLRRRLSQALQTRLRMPRGEFGKDDSVGWTKRIAGGMAAWGGFRDYETMDVRLQVMQSLALLQQPT
jgi:hypothetical protein